ncbi:MAG: hypothetical protein JJU36_13195 [Phycisphaeraceae bacterium]|nr:hypothetical protein [Phycisphaeraceae bacterium]
MTVGFYGPIPWEMKDVESFLDGLQLDRSTRGAPDPKLLLGEDEREEFLTDWFGWVFMEILHPDVRAELIRRDEIHRALQE